MNREPLKSDDSWESDAVWKLLDQAPAPQAGARFVDDTVRAAKLAADVAPWWRRWFAPALLTGLTGATAALVLAFVGSTQDSSNATAALDSPEAFAIQDIAETETLIAAADQLDDFSDKELVSLIGF